MKSDEFRLLLVEDAPTQRTLLELKLRKAGYVVETAADGDEALEKVLSGGFRILITDWDMPGMDGATLCRRVREAQLPSYVYVLLLTAHGSAAKVVAGLEAGADDYLRKPANDAELLARLATGRRIVRLEQSLRQANAHIRMLSFTDPLVGAFNRRYLDEQLALEVERARRYNRPLSIVMADLDRFKAINDEHGHEAGDEVLRGFVNLLRASIRQCDWVARYGGEEFVIVLPETAIAGAVTAAEKIHTQCRAAPVATSTGPLNVTASFGVAQLEQPSGGAEAASAALLRQADGALYASKREGRDRVTAAPRPSLPPAAPDTRP